ncbi:hypothetical protein [Candidatus Phytoplasma sp. AldY-WA1]|uniref:hypothetical protein n=1 Tax=Candidatus Phytoplasma sp. AldY-WA1 TaxID=2852100 RepID=UPI00254CB338|nr:hypothetical protein [Candidatus Phytoplasma sp. AldY-WA1]
MKEQKNNKLIDEKTKNQTKPKFAFLLSPIWLLDINLFFSINNLIALLFDFELGNLTMSLQLFQNFFYYIFMD